MSADNYIFVDKKTFEVWHCCASELVGTKEKGLENQKSSLIGKGKSLEGAIELAEEFEKEIEIEGSYIEYGIHFRLWCK